MSDDRICGTCEVVKINKRLCIRVLESAAQIYSPPDFVTLRSRDALWVLAHTFTNMQRRHLPAIARFEYEHSARGRMALRSTR